MSAIQWSGGKLHGASEAKVQGFLHDTKDTRLTHGHSNPDIDLSRTPDNMSYRGLTYQQKCDRYDELMETVIIKRRSSGANANVTLQKLVMCIPEEMQDGDKYDAAQVQSWLNNVGAILEREFGELLIDIDCHVDEVHQYLDPRKDKDDPDRIVWSRIHLHAAVVPAVWEVVKDKAGNPILDSDGNQVKELVLNAHKFAKKATIVRLNKLVQEMTQQKFGMNFMTGAGKGMKHQSVEDLKRLSAQAMRDEGMATNRALHDPVSSMPSSLPNQDDIGPDPVEYAKKVRHQAEEDAKQITDQAKAAAARISSDAKRQADELQQITIQSAMARMAQMRAKLKLEEKEREQTLQDAQAALARDRDALDRRRAEMDAMQEQVERDKRETAKRLAISRADHLQQRRLNQKALSTEIAATDRMIALNDREESLARQARALRPVATTYNVLKAIHEHERKSENRENANAIRETMRLIYNANSIPDSWIHEVEREYIRSRQQGRRPGSEIAASTARPLPTVAASMPDY